MPAADLKPLTLGDLIDRSARFWRAHLRQLFVLHLGFQLVQYLFMRGFEVVANQWFPVLRGGARANLILQSSPEEGLRQALVGLGAGLVFLFFTIATQWLSSVATAHFVIAAEIASPVGLGAALRRARSRVPAALVGLLVSQLWFLGVLALCLAPATLLTLASLAWFEAPRAALAIAVTGAIVGFLVAVLWFLVRFFLVPQVIGSEDLGTWATLRRAGALVAGRVGPRLAGWVKFRVTVLLTVLALISTAVGLLSGLPALLVRWIYTQPLDPTRYDPDGAPEALLLPADLLSQVLAQSAVGPLFAVMATFFYLDMRMRREGLDLELRLNLLPSRPP